MSVYDRWHKSHPKPDDKPCKEHSRGRNKLYPSSEHLQGKRWQVRWEDLDGKQKSRNFTVKEGKNPDLHAEAFDAKITNELNAGTYIDPAAGEVTLKEYAEYWRKNRGGLDGNEAAALERRLRLHVYEGEPGSGLTPKGGTAIGQRLLRDLARRPSLVQAWITAIPLKDSSAGLIVSDVSAVFRAAADDGAVHRNPVRAGSIGRRRTVTSKAMPWPREYLEAMERRLPGRIGVVPWLGAGTGGRQGELFGLAADDIRSGGKDPRVRIVRQVKLVGDRPYFAPVKNRKEHSPPLAPSLAARLERHMERFPPVPVTLEWYDLADEDMHGRLVTVKLILHDRGGAWFRHGFNNHWRQARRLAGIGEAPENGASARKLSRRDGTHVLRHTAASAWLRAGIDVVRVASWMGDTPEMIWKTYAHMMPERDDGDGREAIDRMLGPGPDDA